MPFCHQTIEATLPIPGYPKHIKHLGDHIKARRISLGLRQETVARTIDVAIDTLRNWERGRTEPEVRCLPAVIAFLSHNPLPSPDTCGQAFRRRRLSLGLSQGSLADLAGVDEGSVRRLEADRKGMARRVLAAVITALMHEADRSLCPTTLRSETS